MLREEGMFKYKDKDSNTIEAPVIAIREREGLLDVFTFQNNTYVRYSYDIETNVWYVCKENPYDIYEPIAEKFDCEVVDFYFTTSWYRNENN